MDDIFSRPFCAFDLETTGQYPVSSEIVEFAAVKWYRGQEIGSYQKLFKPTEPMGDFVIGIHGITNEMVSGCTPFRNFASEIKDFLADSILVAHHAPFDMGFLSWALENESLSLPQNPVICTSLLSRTIIPETTNHRLQTLVKELSLPTGQAHRALDDSRACLHVLLKCLDRMLPISNGSVDYSNLENGISFAEIEKKMRKQLRWMNFSLKQSNSEFIKDVVLAIQKKGVVELVYKGGSIRDIPRKVSPNGIVRNPDGDYFVGMCHIEKVEKRFYFNRISDLGLV